MRLLEKANSMGGPLRDDYRAKIVAYLQNPNVNDWDEVYSIVINWESKPRTVWQALCALDDSWSNIATAGAFFRPPEEKWNRFPDAVTLARALRNALDKK